MTYMSAPWSVKLKHDGSLRRIQQSIEVGRCDVFVEERVGDGEKHSEQD